MFRKHSKMIVTLNDQRGSSHYKVVRMCQPSCGSGWIEVSKYWDGEGYWQNKETKRQRGIETKLTSFSFPFDSVRLIISDTPETTLSTSQFSPCWLIDVCWVARRSIHFTINIIPLMDSVSHRERHVTSFCIVWTWLSLWLILHWWRD